MSHHKLFFVLCTLFMQSAVAEPILIAGESEWLWVPPYLNAIGGSARINAYQPNGRGRQMLPKTFFEFGESLRSMNRVSVQVLFSPKCWVGLQMAGSAVFARPVWKKDENPHLLKMDSGWIYIHCDEKMQVVTPAAAIEFQNSTAWVQVLSSTTEVYQSSGAWGLSPGSATIGQAIEVDPTDLPVKRLGSNYSKVVVNDAKKGLSPPSEWNFADLKKGIPADLLKLVDEFLVEDRSKEDIEAYELAKKKRWNPAIAPKVKK